MFIGNQKIKLNIENVKGEYVEIDGESFYKISNYDKMAPFFLSIVSNSDHWMFISSNGALTAGRKNPDNALFPYYTDDVIHSSSEITGGKSIFHIIIDENIYLWEPFSECHRNIYNITRNIYKNVSSNKIIFEEENFDLGIKFLYSWLNSEKFGFIKRSQIKNIGSKEVKVNLIDGIQNILPYGLYQQFQTELSTLADGYKKNELIEDLGIGIYSLSSIPSDKAEPSESLKATTVWSTGIEVNNYLLSSRQLNLFREGKEIVSEKDIKGTRGAYFINSSISLNHSETKEWLIVSEINQDLTDLTKIKNLFKKEENIINFVLDDVKKGTKSLMKIVASADGLQLSQDKLITSRHFSNVLFNTMRGGIFDNSYIISKNDFMLFVESSSRYVYKKHKSYLDSFNDKIHYDELKKSVKEKGDSELLKISLEYLPLIFSRRHGDPSRPWNYFSIDIRNKDGEKILNYEGNWRDLFQNWEALAISYPEYIEAMITKFLNASTADGYNPYRVTRNGFDWEAPEEDTPWANIGYWGDHQIVYLLKLLELSVKYSPSDLSSRLTTNIYTYANVPYKIKSYKELLADSQNTIDFDYKLHEEIIKNEREVGTEARYLRNQDGKLLQVNLAEKLIVVLLAKLSNFIPGAGIWMNTQRPEWNDANNALVGNGVSMVTLYYIRRYLTFCFNLFSKMDIGAILLTEEVAEMFEAIYKTFDFHKDILKSTITDEKRKTILDSLGIAGENYRNKIYNSGFSNKKKEIKIIDLTNFLSLVRKYVDQTISINKRDDNLYHAYNLMIVNDKDIKITHLYEMLEGQVAVLSSGYLSADQAVKILAALRNSSLYREDQNSYILYPDRELPQFVNKNTISGEDFKTSKLLQKLIESKNNDIVLEDEDRNIHFNGEIRNAKYLSSKLEILKTKGFGYLIDLEGQKILDLYESQFNHKSFTGRSGTFYKYEGLGCIYWHMVSKLVLAVQETYFEAYRNSISYGELETLKNYYYQIKDGLGVHKSPEEYGAFPTDPYSHTPSFSGVQQPGMTGQVKEDIISRFGEFGVQVIDGEIAIVPSLLNTEEFLLSDESFNYFDIYGDKQNLKVNKNSLAFTFCQVPFIYSTFSDENLIIITKKNGDKVNTNNLQIDKEISRSIFKRDGKIIKVEVLLGNSENP